MHPSPTLQFVLTGSQAKTSALGGWGPVSPTLEDGPPKLAGWAPWHQVEWGALPGGGDPHRVTPSGARAQSEAFPLLVTALCSAAPLSLVRLFHFGLPLGNQSPSPDSSRDSSVSVRALGFMARLAGLARSLDRVRSFPPVHVFACDMQGCRGTRVSVTGDLPRQFFLPALLLWRKITCPPSSADRPVSESIGAPAPGPRQMVPVMKASGPGGALPPPGVVATDHLGATQML